MTQNNVSLVSGGAGFIGSHLCEALLALGHQVICLDNLLTGRERNISHIKSNPSFTFLRWDVITQIPVFPHIEYVFHLASPASVPDYQTYPEETALVNSVGTRNLLHVAKTYAAKFLYTSTSEVYGDPLEHPQTETYWGNVNPIGVRACYDEAKRFGEMMTMTYVRSRGVDARIIRIFNTYGPRMRVDDGRVLSNFITQALTGRPLTIYGAGNQTRSFCYVDDMVEALIQAMFSENTRGEVINIGNPEEYTMNDVAKMVLKKTGSQSEIQNTSLPQDDPEKRRPDISKAQKLFGWKPNTSFEAGLQRMITYYEALKKQHEL